MTSCESDSLRGGDGGKHGVQGTVQSWEGDFSTGSECITKFRKERKLLATLPQSARAVQLYPKHPLDTPSLILPPPTSRGSANPLDPALHSPLCRGPQMRAVSWDLTVLPCLLPWLCHPTRSRGCQLGDIYLQGGF